MRPGKITYMSIAAMAVAGGIAQTLSDAELKQEVVQQLSPRCGGQKLRDEPRREELIDRLELGGDTNRLAHVLAELAQTNDAWYAKMAMWQLEKYATSEQLPFLYSCATNPAVGNMAVKAVFHAEGVTSNSVAVLERYLTFEPATNENMYDKSVVCREALSHLKTSMPTSPMRTLMIDAVRRFASGVSLGNSMVDAALLDTDSTYRYSKRRLADMRAAYPRCFNEYQTNYVANAISELVAYPESDLVD